MQLLHGYDVTCSQIIRNERFREADFKFFAIMVVSNSDGGYRLWLHIKGMIYKIPPYG